ncbi:hypothetical protein KO02_10430 [Sphingobacterium sp. ML3W]|nr:hypothetical protein KO02_10430 [Sphingobacterium sp. ML3W]
MMGDKDEKKREGSPDLTGQMWDKEDDLSESDLGLFNLFFCFSKKVYLLSRFNNKLGSDDV